MKKSTPQKAASATIPPDRRAELIEKASRLFGERGYTKTSMRDISAAFGILHGSLYHHFGSKEELYLEAFFRRARPSNVRRLAELAALRAAQQDDAPLAVADILRCLLSGPLTLSKEHPGFMRLLARNLTQPPPFAIERIRREMDPLSGPFIMELARALPALPRPVLAFRLMLTGGGLFFLLHHWPNRAQLGHLPKGEPALQNLPPEIALELLVQFAAAGLAAPPPVSAGLPAMLRP
jgi:AcrR family transcriptional regulator